MGDIRRGIHEFATGFRAASDALRGIDGGNSSNVDTSHAAAEGYVGAAATSATIISGAAGTAIGDLTSNGGLAAAFDGITSQTFANGAVKATSANGFSNAVGKDWGVGNTRKIGRFTVYSVSDNSLLGSAQTTNLKLQGSNDNSQWDDLTSSVAVVGANGSMTDVTTGITTTTAYRYHRVNIQGNGTNGINVAEIVFYDAGIIQDMTLVTTAQTADASVSNARVLIEYDPIDAITLNTDLIVEVTCDGGTNWSVAALTAAGTGQGGRSIAETANTACTAGTSFAARIKTLNNKNVRLYGATVTAH